MNAIFPLAGAALVLLEVVGAVTETKQQLLPLGGTHVAQIAVVFGSAFVVHEFLSVFHR